MRFDLGPCEILAETLRPQALDPSFLRITPRKVLEICEILVTTRRDVGSRAGIPVKANRVTTDDEVANVVGVEQPQKLAEVGRQSRIGHR